jgi:SAM-dependent methyltransferase
LSDWGDWGVNAAIWDRHWGRMADPARVAIADRTSIGPGMRLLDMGCGTGEFCALAIERGAEAAGIDGAEGMIEVARRKLDRADLRVGRIEELPWGDDSFDVVTGVNSFQFAAERVAGFREAKRVTRPGGLVATCVWGPRERNDLIAIIAALAALDPDSGPDDRGPGLGEPGVMEGLAREANLDPVESGDVEIAYEVADREELLAASEFDVALLGLRDKVDAELIEGTILATAAPQRRPDGSYRFDNIFRWLISRA